jgi:hypothetical protein
MLDDLITTLAGSDTHLRFAELKDPVKDRLRRYGLFARLGADAFYPTVGTAVDGYVAASGIDWVDWEDRGAEDAPPSGSSSVST